MANVSNQPQFPSWLAEFHQRLTAITDSQRMTQLVDYLDDLRCEFDLVAAELKQLGFCAPCYFSELDDGDGHDCAEEY